jgi:hypothetical protein
METDEVSDCQDLEMVLADAAGDLPVLIYMPVWWIHGPAAATPSSRSEVDKHLVLTWLIWFGA